MNVELKAIRDHMKHQRPQVTQLPRRYVLSPQQDRHRFGRSCLALARL